MTSPMTYRLPTSQIVVSGSVCQRQDALEPEHVQTSWDLVAVMATLVTRADLTTLCSVEAPVGWFRTTKASFGVAADGRLSSASSESTGEVGAVLKSVASIAGSAAAFLALGDVDKAAADAARVLTAYKGERPEVGNRIERLKEARRNAQDRLVATLIDLDSDPMIVHRLRQRVQLIDEQLVPLMAQLQIWRDSKITTTTVSFEFTVAVKDAPTKVRPRKEAEPTSEPATLDALWDRYGYAVSVNWLEGTDGARPKVVQQETIDVSDTHTVWTRRPEQIELCLSKWEKDIGKAVGIERSRHAVADGFSKVVGYKLKKSIFAHKSSTLGFDADGFVSTISTESSSEAAGALASLSGLSESFSGGAENATKAFSSVQAAGRASLEAENARVKAEIDQRQQALTTAGLDATAGDAVKLQRLTQLQAILAAQTAITGTDPSLVMGLAQQAGGDLAWYEPPAPAGPKEPQVIRVEYADPTHPPVPTINPKEPPVV